MPFPPKTIRAVDPSTSGRRTDDPVLAEIRRIQTEKRARQPINMTPYATADVQSYNDLDIFNEKQKQPQVPQRPPITALTNALDEFAKKPIRQLQFGSEEYKRALRDPKNSVKCPLCRSYSTLNRNKMAAHIGQHPEVERYYRWLLNKVQGPYQHWLEQYDRWESEVDRCASAIERRQPFLEALKKRRLKIEDKFGISESLVAYGHDSPEYQTARQNSIDELNPVIEEIGKVQDEIHIYERLKEKARRQRNIADIHLGEMENDPHIAPLLEPVELSGGKQTSLVAEELEMLRPILNAAFHAETFERSQSVGSTPMPSKGLIPRGTVTIDKGPDTKSLQDYHPDGEKV
jgi:hypothetical protein